MCSSQRRFCNNFQTALVVGASIHTANICLGLYSEWCQGPAYAEITRETNHSPEAITGYVKKYKRIPACLHKGLTPKETAFVVKVSEKPVFEYVNLIQENQVDINEQIGQDGYDFNDLPF